MKGGKEKHFFFNKVEAAIVEEAANHLVMKRTHYVQFALVNVLKTRIEHRKLVEANIDTTRGKYKQGVTRQVHIRYCLPEEERKFIQDWANSLNVNFPQLLRAIVITAAHKLIKQKKKIKSSAVASEAA